MFDNKVFSILSIILLLAIGCKDSPVKVEVPTADVNTLNNPDLGDGRPLNDYWYHFNDEAVDAQFLYYNQYFTRGANTFGNYNPYLDTLNFRTFPYYTVSIAGGQDTTISYMLGLTDNKSADNYYAQYSKLYPLDETNTSTQNWCNEILVEYEGDCPETVEVKFDYQIFSTTGEQYVDTLVNPAAFEDLISTKKSTFSVAWTNIDSLIWETQNKRYRIEADTTSNVKRTTLCAGVCDSSYIVNNIIHLNDPTLVSCYDPALTSDAEACFDSTYVIRKLKNSNDPDSLYEADKFDSLIYVGIIDTNRFLINSLTLIDRTEWDMYDSIYYSSTSKTLSLDTIFTYEKIEVPVDGPMFRVNTDCNQNLMRDLAEYYADFGEDWCPDSLESGAGKCQVVDTNGENDLFDEEPCNCLYNWTDPQAALDTVNISWKANNAFDPNGDNWRDCGIDGLCPEDDDYEGPDFNGSESNGVWDTEEDFEENYQYNFNIQNGTGEYFIDLGNGVDDEPAEFCVTGTDGVCNGNDPFEDRNCNGQWDDEESGDEGNGIWDDAEDFLDSDGNKEWYDGDGNWQAAEPLYILSDRMETFIVDYSDRNNPVPITTLDSTTSIDLFYGNYENPQYISYANFITAIEIQASYSESFYDIDSIVTIYTNKIMENPVPGIVDDYHITKTKWFQDIEKTSFDEDNFDNPEYGYDYGYEYHLFKSSENSDIIKMVHPLYFNYYGYYYSFEKLQLGTWRKADLEEETYIYTYDGLLRDGEYYYQDTTIITDVADYYVQNIYEVTFDSSVVVPFKKVRYNVDEGDTTCKSASTATWLNHPDVDIIVENNYMKYCPPIDTTLTNTYKITRTKTMTMIGSGVEFGMKNTIWLGSEGPGDPLGIVKDQLEIRWGEPYWEEYGSDWNLISRIELTSLQTESASSSFFRLFQPIQNLSLNKLGNEGKFDNEPYVVNSSYGIQRLVPPIEK